MSLGLALNNALSGLRVNQESIAVLSQNIANVNTLGYSRQILNQSAVAVAGKGNGVQIDDITRKIDKYLQRSVQTQSSVNATNQSLSSYYTNLQSLMGTPGAANSIDTAITSMFNALQQSAESPDINSLKTNAIAAAVGTAKRISDLAANVQDLRLTADTAINDAVAAVNASLNRLQDINAALGVGKANNESTATLQDSRDKEINTLASYLDISVSYTDSGAANVVAGDGSVLMEEGVKHQLSYTRVPGVNALINDTALSPLQVLTLDGTGKQVATPRELISGGKLGTIKTGLTGGTLFGLQQIRDVKFPAILEQMDQLASRLRDGVNTIHNQGSGYPAATSLTGDRVVHPTDQFSWAGTLRIAVLQSDGSPVPSSYSDETYTGVRPLLLNLGTLDSGLGGGKPTLQTIVDEINNHFAAPTNKVELGNMNNIRLASDTTQLPSGAPSLFNFDLDLENISTTTSNIFINSITVFDDTATNITSVTQAAPSYTINPSNSFTTVLGSADVTVNLSSLPSNVQVGDKIYMNAPSAPVNGISIANMTGYFTVTAVSGNTVTFTAAAAATSSGTVNDAGNIQMMARYDSVPAGGAQRTTDEGQLQVDLNASPASAYYDIALNVSVIDASGNISTAPITYRVNNNESQLLNKRYNVLSAGAPATVVLPNSSQQTLRAMIVDANGNELPKVNGKYVDGAGYLKIVGGTSSQEYGVAIDEMNSQQLGLPDDNPPQAGTNWGFSHYFGLNNFFVSNELTTTGDTTVNSAYKLRVQDRLTTNGNLLSTGNITPQAKSAATQNRVVYTYERNAGDNSIIQRLAAFNTTTNAFDPAGGLPTAQISLNGYASEVLGFISQRSTEAKDNATNAQSLYDGFKARSDAISAVNLDEELANTITFQNAYSATARVITTVNKMYDDLLSSL